MGGVQLMGDERISGATKKVRGSITEALGKLTGEKAVENRGAMQKREAEKELRAGASKKPAKENPHNSGYIKRRTLDK
jgi:uncharacterized protein YjbJ (UPF0337 family)